ncbi:UbiH/UbiF/VisC/COQ6 family ubiquinone biosynthesis hydroxylase [Vannielia litorea]|uniref:UbiH/UbiF/VisC/COQ6 family ubiquinone biosynthesis hydroxylase n=1 Tax=Vannielia litorea TaxID=1217970 RepID=UPI001C96B2BF|nr:UbiH/UbiF/VisC/COQ6 family ubiquinone biosynthesis hydroxylase [Vannielia litorea]MBY6154822.1 UbiH/UbiF/VisC/COQ6 family ubiquinone biosynthesis hydroxylase [Vannielia litorea]
MDNPACRAIVRPMFDADVIIAGGALTGASLALALAKGGARVVVVDRLPAGAQVSPDFDGRSYALALASQRLFRALGVWEAVAEKAQPILHVKTGDGRAGEGVLGGLLHLDHGEIDEGPMGFMLEDRHLRPALMAALAGAEGVTVLAGEEIVAQEVQPGHVAVTLASGRVLKAALLAGADGRGSPTARRAGIARRDSDYGQTALTCAVAHERPHGGVAHQFFMPSGPLAILPLPGDRSSIVWSERRDRAEELAKASDEAFLEALRPVFGDFLGEIRLEGVRFAYPLGLTVAERIVAERVALVGDAAQGIHPIAGQGLNQGLRDVATLAEVVTEARRRGEDCGSALVLERHRAWRSFDRTALTLATDGFNRLFSNDNPLLRAARDLGVSAVAAVPELRQRFMREAAGLTGDLPRLLQGKAL